MTLYSIYARLPIAHVWRSPSEKLGGIDASPSGPMLIMRLYVFSPFRLGLTRFGRAVGLDVSIVTGIIELSLRRPT